MYKILSARDKLLSLIADEAKNGPIINSSITNLQQMKAKHSFRLALLNQLLEDMDNGQISENQIQSPKI